MTRRTEARAIGPIAAKLIARLEKQRADVERGQHDQDQREADAPLAHLTSPPRAAVEFNPSTAVAHPIEVGRD